MRYRIRVKNVHKLGVKRYFPEMAQEIYGDYGDYHIIPENELEWKSVPNLFFFTYTEKLDIAKGLIDSLIEADNIKKNKHLAKENVDEYIIEETIDYPSIKEPTIVGDFTVEPITKFKAFHIDYEIKKNNKFVVEFDDSEIKQWVVKKVKRPAYNFDTWSWDDIEFELNDPIGPSASRMVFNGLIYNKNHKTKNTSKITINMFDPIGEIIESWVLEGKYISVEFSDLDYLDNEQSTIKINFKIISCKLKE